MISGKKVVLETEAGGEACGFVKNEYVWADTEEQAIAKAKEKVNAGIRKKPGVRMLDDSPLDLTVDETEVGLPVWKLASNEGFVFFDV